MSDLIPLSNAWLFGAYRRLRASRVPRFRQAHWPVHRQPRRYLFRAGAERGRSDARRLCGTGAHHAQELGGAFQRFQDSTSQRMDAGIEAPPHAGRTAWAKARRRHRQDGPGCESPAARPCAPPSKRGWRSVWRPARQCRAGFAKEELTGKLRTHQRTALEHAQAARRTATRTPRQSGGHDHRSHRSPGQRAGGFARQTVEARLDTLRTENSAKLDQIRQTVDEKLQTALEKRLGESFRTVSEQLAQVYKQRSR